MAVSCQKLSSSWFFLPTAQKKRAENCKSVKAAGNVQVAGLPDSADEDVVRLMHQSGSVRFCGRGNATHVPSKTWGVG